MSFGFGERLRSARKRAGLTGEELGKGAGENGKDASKASVSDWEHERHYPKADQLRIICLKLGITADDLIFGDLKDAKLRQAAGTLQGLNEEQKRALMSMMMASATGDKQVEAKLPITKARAFQYSKKNTEAPHLPAAVKRGAAKKKGS